MIFDSRAPIGTGQGVYVSAIAEELAGTELDRGIGVYSRRSQAHGVGARTREDVASPARQRLYRATASEHSVLDDKDRRTLVRV